MSDHFTLDHKIAAARDNVARAVAALEEEMENTSVNEPLLQFLRSEVTIMGNTENAIINLKSEILKSENIRRDSEGIHIKIIAFLIITNSLSQRQTYYKVHYSLSYFRCSFHPLHHCVLTI